jgi:hypothetical protein
MLTLTSYFSEITGDLRLPGFMPEIAPYFNQATGDNTFD